jgi:hypothetical protein
VRASFTASPSPQQAKIDQISRLRGETIHFHRPDGSRQPANSGAPPVLVAFGEEELFRLHASGIHGFLVTAWHEIGRRETPHVAEHCLRCVA